MSSASLCVYCRRYPASAAYRPFCSERCKLQDLAQWVDGRYRIPGDPVALPEDADGVDPTDSH